MFEHVTHVHLRFLIVALCSGVTGASTVTAQEVLHVYGSEGPYPAMREAATVFGDRNNVDLQIVADPVEKWLDKAKANADLVYSSAEFMMVDLIRDMEDQIVASSVIPLYWRPAAILVRPGNPKHIHDLPDLLRSDVKVMVKTWQVGGATSEPYAPSATTLCCLLRTALRRGDGGLLRRALTPGSRGISGIRQILATQRSFPSAKTMSFIASVALR